MEMLSIYSSKKRKRSDGQVDRQVFTAFEAPERRLDGHVAVVFHERRTKTNQNQADVTQENVERHRRTKANSVNRTPSHVTFSRVSQHTHFNVARDIGSRLKVSCACHPCVIRMLLLS